MTVRLEAVGVTLLTKLPEGLPVNVSKTSNSILLGKALVLSKSTADIDLFRLYEPEFENLNLWDTPWASFNKNGVKSILYESVDFSTISKPNNTDLAKASSTALFSNSLDELDIYLKLGWINKILLPLLVK